MQDCPFCIIIKYSNILLLRQVCYSIKPHRKLPCMTLYKITTAKALQINNNNNKMANFLI